MAVSWGFSMLLVVTIVALFTFSQPLFQLAIPAGLGFAEAVEKQTQTDLEIVSQAVAVPPRNYPDTSKLKLQARDEAGSKSSSSTATWTWDILRRGTSRRQQWTRKLIDRQDQRTQRVKISRRSVLASFQSDRMVPTGPNPLHNSNRSQVIFP